MLQFTQDLGLCVPKAQGPPGISFEYTELQARGEEQREKSAEMFRLEL